ncbi:sigma factor [Bacillus cereus]|uniref:sigma factor n=1 Tax=Bacillus cereus TaxID=1396 RepID=UPI00398117F0
MKNKHTLEEIYKQHMHELFRYLLSLTGDFHSAEDLMQETFYRMLVHMALVTKNKNNHSKWNGCFYYIN